jgi:hypothetical protein
MIGDRWNASLPRCQSDVWLKTGPSGSNAVVESSTDSKTWTPIQTNLLSPTGLDLSVPLTNAHQFFRAHLTP